RRLRQRHRTDRRHRRAGRFRDQRRLLPGGPPGERLDRPRHRGAEGRGRRRGDARDQPVLLRHRRLPAVPRPGAGGRDRGAADPRHHAGDQFRRAEADVRRLRRRPARLAGGPFRRAGRRSGDPPADRRLGGRRDVRAAAGGRLRRLPLLHPEPGRPGLRHLPGAGRSRTRGPRMTRTERLAALDVVARERILILDGAWGVMLQRERLEEADYRGDLFTAHNQPLKGDHDLLGLTRPDIVTRLHDAYFAAGADIASTNTFNATAIAQADYGQEAAVRDINLAAARLARASADRWTRQEPHKPRFVAGSIGPTNRTLSLSPDVNDPGFRAVTFDQVYDAYRQQALALHEGGVDIFLIETVFDTLNCKAAIKAILDLQHEGLERLPPWISGTITDRSGRTLSGQTVEAFWNSIRHARPWAVGLNCALGADLMRPHLAELARSADTLVAAYPNAGLPNAMGEYDEQPDETAGQ